MCGEAVKLQILHDIKICAVILYACMGRSLMTVRGFFTQDKCTIMSYAWVELMKLQIF